MNIENPYQDCIGGHWLRGNLHAHTVHSDGKRTRQAVVDDYAARGYDFLMISDHDVHTSPQDHAALHAKGMTLIPGNEISASGEHVLHVNSNCRVEPVPDRQTVIDDINHRGGFAIVAHPNWNSSGKPGDWNHAAQEKLLAWRGFKGIEIYNGVINRLGGSPYATDRWDRMLSSGRRAWGYANDDSHAETGDVALGWNMVYAKDRSAPSIVAALAEGRFYPSTGVVITRIDLKGGKIRIETENADRILAFAAEQRRFAFADAKTLEVDIPSDEPYVRFECWGRGEQFAWTQPFYISR